LNKIVEQDPRTIKRILLPRFGFQSLQYARPLLASIEIMHMIKKGELDCLIGQVSLATTGQFYSLRTTNTARTLI